MIDAKEKLKRDIFKQVKKYYALVHKPHKFDYNKDKIHYGGRVYSENEIVNLVDSSLEFWLTYGRYSRQFEARLAKFLGVKNCFFVNSGSSANLIAFMALTSDRLGKSKINKGDEVITTAMAFPTTVSPIIQYGAVPVFVDITLGDYNVDVGQLKKALSRRTKAVVLAHALGNPFMADIVKNFCIKHGLWLIEDNCDSLGSLYKGRYTGSFGDIATSSFYPAHHITTGEGGAVYTNNNVLAKILLSLRDWGRDCWCLPGKDNTCGKRFKHKIGHPSFEYDHKYIYSHFGYNFKATDMQAAIGCAQLAKLSDFIKKRRENFNQLYVGLKDTEEYFVLPKATNNSQPSWFGFILTVKKNAFFNRHEIVQYLENHNIQTRLLFAGNIVQQPCFNAMRNSGNKYRVVGDLKNTDYLMRNSFWIGVYPGLNDIMLKKIIGTINGFIRAKK